MTCSVLQTYSRTMDFIAAQVAMTCCSPGDSTRGLPSIMGSIRDVTVPSRSHIQLPLQPSGELPQTTGASIAAMTSVGQVLLCTAPSGPDTVRSKERPGPSRSAVRTLSTQRENRCSLVIVTSGMVRWQKMQACWGMAGS